MGKKVAKGVLGVLILVVFLFVVLVSVAASRIYEEPKKGYNFSSYRALGPGALPPIPTATSPGAKLPEDLVVYTLGGEKVALQTLWKEKPLVIEFGSQTCPVFQGGGVSMDGLAAKYKDRANVVLMYTREAHPGRKINQHDSMEEKLELAGGLASKLKRKVYVDGLDGDVHRYLGLFPNAAYIIGTDGVVAYRTTWTQPDVLKAKLDVLLEVGGEGKKMKGKEEYRCVMPLHLSDEEHMGYMFSMMEISGEDALPDFVFNGPMSREKELDLSGCPQPK